MPSTFYRHRAYAPPDHPGPVGTPVRLQRRAWGLRRASGGASVMTREVDAPVLVIEDNSDIREGLEALLRMEGFDVVAAQNGRDALEMLEKGLRPCIIIIDLMMPVMNGFEFRAEQLRRPELATIPVIACSGVADAVQSAGQLGAKALVQKPTRPEQLIALVHRHCTKPANNHFAH